MTGPIELSRPERIAAIAEMRKHTRVAVAAVEDIIAAINKVRVGDPVGTIRRDPEHGFVAIRCKDTYDDAPHWLEVSRSGATGRVKTPSGGIVTDWPVIFEPEVTE